MRPKPHPSQLCAKAATALMCAGILFIGAANGLASVATAMQATAPATRFVGTISAISPGALTVKTDSGTERKVTVPDGIKIQRIAPGEKDLSKAAVIQFSNLSVGDRVLVRIAPEPASDPVSAIGIIAIPQADLAQKQQKEREDWQRNGVGGLVKSVDAGTGIIVVTSGAGATQKTITLHTTPATILRRYAPDSISYDQAKLAPLEVIKVGDQLRARGTKSADGTELAAAEVVSGSFRNIAGTISSINTGADTVTLKDLATKQTVTVHIGPDTQMRKLPEQMAKTLAAATKTGGAAAGTATGGMASASAPGKNRSWNGAPGSAAGAGQTGQPGQPGQSEQTGQAAGQAAGQGQSRNGGMRPQGGGAGGEWTSRPAGGVDPQQMLARAPAIKISDLQKGDAIMLVSTEGSSDVTAITLLAGVEPLLQAPASTQSMLLSNWNMSSGGAEAAQ